ncbi:hypothetical protein AB3S75_036602 [Citrus x aurantiifolia]
MASVLVMHALIKRGREIDAYRSMQPVVTNQEPVIEQHEASRPEETSYIDCPFLQSMELAFMGFHDRSCI